jgi:hypothetical protein
MEAVTDEVLAESGWSWQEPVAVQLVDTHQATTGTVTVEDQP